MDPQEQEVVGYEDYKSIKDRPPSPFLAPDKGSIIDDELDLDAKERSSFQDVLLKPEESENGSSNQNGELLKTDGVTTRRRSCAVNDANETYTADDFVTAYDQRVVCRPPNAEIYPDAELKPRDSETKENTNKLNADALPSDTSLRDPRTPVLIERSISRERDRSVSRERERSISREHKSRERSVSREGSSLDIHSVIGKDGVRMFNALLAAARKDVGLKRAWQLKADIFKCMIKTKLLVESNKIQLEELEPFKEPLNNLGNLFLQLLADKRKYSFEESAIKPTLFATLCNQLGQMWNKLLEPHMDAMDLAKGQAVVEFLSAPKFIATFLSDSDFVDEKKMMKIHARRILKSKLKPTCVKSKCTKARLAGWSRYCPAHHLARFEHLYATPNFDSFVKGEETAEFLSFHTFFADLVFEAPPGLGGPPVNPTVPAAARHSLSGTSPNTILGTPGSPMQTKSTTVINASGFALNPESNLSPRQRNGGGSQERSLLGNHGQESVSAPNSPSIIHRPSLFHMNSSDRALSPSIADPSSPRLSNAGATPRPCQTHVSPDVNPLGKRASLTHVSPTEVNTLGRGSLSGVRSERFSADATATPVLKRASVAHISSSERTLSSDSTPATPVPSKRPSLAQVSPTELPLSIASPSQLLPSLPNPGVLEGASNSQNTENSAASRASPLRSARSLGHSRGLSVNVGSENDATSTNSPSIATRPILTTGLSNEGTITTTSETTAHNTPPLRPSLSERNLGAPVGVDGKSSEFAGSADKAVTVDSSASIDKSNDPPLPYDTKSPKNGNSSPQNEIKSIENYVNNVSVPASGNTQTSASTESVASKADDGNSVDRPSRTSESKGTPSELKASLPNTSKISASGSTGNITTLHSRHGSEVHNTTTHAEWNKRLLHLYLDLLRLQACNTVKDRGAVSKQIFDKYLQPDAASCVNLWRHPSVEFPLPKPHQRAGAVHPLLVPINTAIESGLAAVQPGVFMPLFKFIEAVLRTAFEAFAGSTKYKERLEQFRLPEQFLAALDDKQAEQESEDRLWEESCVVRFESQLEYIDPVNYSTLPS